MKYMLSIYEAERDWEEVPSGELDAALAEHGAFVQQLEDRGVPFFGEALRPSSTASTVRREGTKTLVSDGPFVELKEYLAGFYVIDVANLDDALEIAGRCPTDGAVEVRPVWGAT